MYGLNTERSLELLTRAALALLCHLILLYESLYILYRIGWLLLHDWDIISSALGNLSGPTRHYNLNIQMASSRFMNNKNFDKQLAWKEFLKNLNLPDIMPDYSSKAYW